MHHMNRQTRNGALGANILARQSNSNTARDRRRRQRAHERAGRLYDRQFAAEAQGAGAGGEGSPRAALYEGKMGSSHRKSARMQRSSEAGPVSAKVNPAGWFAGLNISQRSLRIGTALLCIVLVFVFLYTPAKQYYQAQRESSRLAAEYSVVEQRNEVLDAQNDTLASNAGMEDAVRQKFGYVVQGDQTAVVTGLSENAQGAAMAADNDDLEANVLSSTVKAPEEWYTPFLDAFFGVQ